MIPADAPVSVVIPCWRCADTIDRAVRSVAGQTLRPMEIILVEDCSGDATLATLHRLEKEHPTGWIKIIARPENSGAGAARNAGWQAAAAPYIAFLDADDAWFPRKLEMQLGWMRDHPETVLTGHGSVLWHEGLPMPALPDPIPTWRVTLPQMLISNRFLTRTTMVRRDVPFRFGGRFETEDYSLWLDLVASRAPCFVLDAPLACCFRPEASPGGYSGQLWKHERRELRTLHGLYRKGALSRSTWALAAGWSLVKYLRRVVNRWRA